MSRSWAKFGRNESPKQAEKTEEEDTPTDTGLAGEIYAKS